jgi:hypothetical protein
MALWKYSTFYSKNSMELGHSSFTNLHFGTSCEKNHKKKHLNQLETTMKTNVKKDSNSNLRT